MRFRTKHGVTGNGVVGDRSLRSKEIVRIDGCLEQDRAQRTFWHIDRVVRHGCIPVVDALNQISWLPAACRSKAKPSAFNFRAISR